MLPEQLAWALGLLQQHGLKPWVDTGTALGLAREGGILWEPGKDDIDLSLWAEDEPRLAALAARFQEAGYSHERWLWRGQVFKWKFVPEPGVGAGAYPIDFKLYRRAGEHCWTPLVYHRSAPTKPLWLLWQRWRKSLLAKGPDRRLGQWPWNTCIGVHTFWVPRRFFEELAPWRDSVALMPRDWQAFLELHYGDWTTPQHPWDSAAQDGAIQHGNPEHVLARMASTAEASP